MKIIEKEKAIFLYHSGKSLSEIGFLFGVSSATILNRFKKWGVCRRSVSDSLKGRNILWADKISLGLTGKILPKTVRDKISKTRIEKHIIPWNFGLRKSTHPQFIKYGKPGESHWNWKGGISRYNNLLRQTPEYKTWRDNVFKRDNYTCVFCDNGRGGNLEAHHIIPVKTLLKCDSKELKDLIFDVVNGYTLHKKCHKELHHGK